MATIMHNSGSYPHISVDEIRSTRSDDLPGSTTNGYVSNGPLAQATADEEPHYSHHSRMRIDDYRRHVSNRQYRDTTVEETRMTGTRYYKHPDYESKDNRKDSFTYSEWCKQEDSVNPAGLVDAGFYYTGHGTRVRCFSCGLGLSHIKPDDNLWEEHALRTDECSFLAEQKGETFIQEIKDRVLPDRYPNGRVPYFTRNRRHHRHARWAEAEMEIADMTEQSIFDTLPDVDNHVQNNTRTDLLFTDDRENADEETLLKENKILKEHMLCKSCRNEAPSYVLQPCGHLALCDTCSSNQTTCPVCKGLIEKMVKIYIS